MKIKIVKRNRKKRLTPKKEKKSEWINKKKILAMRSSNNYSFVFWVLV
jgi:hypothetical protein